MTCHRIPNGVVCVAPQHEFTHAGRTWRFEIGMMGYPWPLKRDGTPWKDLPGERHPFWRAFEAWSAQRAAQPSGT